MWYSMFGGVSVNEMPWLRRKKMKMRKNCVDGSSYECEDKKNLKIPFKKNLKIKNTCALIITCLTWSC
jgi:hypothetical protein